MSNIVLDKETFLRRIKRLYDEWNVNLNESLKKRTTTLLDTILKVIQMLYHNVQRKADSDIPIVIFFMLAMEQHPTITHDDSLKKVDCIMSVV
ncbi:hypothetical protein DOY81_015619, partial [Sarcophaga bullata]